MTQYEIRHFYCSDTPRTGLEYDGDPSSFVLPIQVYIGEVGHGGADLYQVLIASRDRDDGGFPHTIVLPEWDAEIVAGLLKAIVERANRSGDVHPQAVLRRWFQWEYENYHIETDDGDLDGET